MKFEKIMVASLFVLALVSHEGFAQQTQSNEVIFGVDGPWAQPLGETQDQQTIQTTGPKLPRPAPVVVRIPTPEPGTRIPEPRVPDTRTPNGDANDPFLMISPAPEYDIRGGYVMNADDHGQGHGGGIGVVMFLDTGRLALMIDGGLASTSSSYFSYGELGAKVQFRIPFDPNHIIWGGLGLDIRGRGVLDPRLNGYFKAQLPVALIGTMFSAGRNHECVIHLFAKAAFGIYDSDSQANIGRWARPAVGSEALLSCGSIRVTADYEHVFRVSSTEGDTDRTSLNLSQVFPVNADGSVQLGYFIQGGYTRQGAVSDLPPTDSRSDPRNVGEVFTGLEVRFGARPKPY